MSDHDMPRGGLYEAINKIRVEAAFAELEERRSTFSGGLALLRDQLPPSGVAPEQAARLFEEYSIREQARRIADAVATKRI